MLLRALRLRLWTWLRLRPIHLRLRLRLRPVHLWLRLRPIHLRLRATHLWLWLRLRPVHLRLRPIHLWLRPVTRRGRPAHIIIRIIRRRTIHRRRCRTTCPPIGRRTTRTSIGRRTGRIIIRRWTPRIGRSTRVIHRRPHYSRIRRPPMIHRSKLIPVTRRVLLMLLLLRCNRDMPFLRRLLLPRIRTIIHSTGTAIIAYLVDSYIIDDRLVDICIMYNGGVDIRHRRIIPETPTIPFATIIPAAAITAAVINTTVISYMRTPITTIPSIDPAHKTPITRRP